MIFLIFFLSIGPILGNFFPESLFVTIYAHFLLVIITLILVTKERFAKTRVPLLAIILLYFISILASILRGHEPFWLFIGAVDNLKTLVPLLLMLALPNSYFVPKKSYHMISIFFGLILFVSILGGVLSQFSIYVKQLLDVSTAREMIRYSLERSSSIYIGVNMFVKMSLVSFLGMSIRRLNLPLATILWLALSLLTFSRQFILGTFVSLLVGFVMSGIKVTILKRYIKKTLFAGFALFFFFLFVSINSESSNFSESDGKLYDFSGSVLRAGVGYAAVNCALSYPFGAGPGNFGGNIGKKIENNDYLYECGVHDVFPFFDLALHYTDTQFFELLGSLGFGVIVIFLIIINFIKKIALTLDSGGKFIIYSASVFVGLQFLVSPVLNYFEFILPFVFILRVILSKFTSVKRRI